MLKPKLPKILATFQKTLAQLNILAESHQKDINAHEDEILFREKAKSELAAEREKALRIAGNIANMLEATPFKKAA